MNRRTLLLTAEINCITDHVYCLKVTLFIYLKAVVVSSRVLTCSFLPSFEHNLQKKSKISRYIALHLDQERTSIDNFPNCPFYRVQFVSSPKKL